MTAYYNEFDAYPAQWLRNLSDAGHIATGDVDERSIRDVQPADVAGATQAHFFAGIGAWSYALRLAGWPDDRPVFTGSCPCQPFSVAGRRGGVADERHLWPEWFRIIRECRPPVVFGEQVASPDGLVWLDAVSSDLESQGYAFAAADLAAASVGAPHIRQRLFFVAYALPAGRAEGWSGAGCRPAPGRGGDGGLAYADGIRAGLDTEGVSTRQSESRGNGGAGALAYADPAGLGELRLGGLREDGDAQRGHDADGRGADGRMGHPDREHAGRNGGGVARAQAGSGGARGVTRSGVGDESCVSGGACGVADSDGGVTRDGKLQRGRRHDERPAYAAARNPWRDIEWIPCSDGVSRPAQPGIFPLAHGATARVGRLRAYGNAIVPQVAAAFVRAFMEAAS